MPTAFPSVGHSGSQSISLLTQNTACTEEQDEPTQDCATITQTVIVCRSEQFEDARGGVPATTVQVRASSAKTSTATSPAATSPAATSPAATSPATPTLKSTAQPVARSSSAPLHRLAEVRAQQGLSLRTVSRRTGIEVKELKHQEAPCSDLLLSQLIAWQKALEVPLVDLLEDENQALSRPVQERAKMVRIMKTVVSLCEVSASQPRLSRLATMLREQVLDLMPELAEIGGWPQCGSRRGADVMGRIFHEPVSVELGGLE